MTSWIDLQRIFLEVTSLNWQREEIEYLEHAYTRCEVMRNLELAKLHSVKLVIIGEAPLFGDSENYIYSQSAPQTQFLYASDFPEGSISEKLTSLQKKHKLLERMTQRGIIVVDAFPYALNMKSTPTLYFQSGPNKIGITLYKDLLNKVFHAHTAPIIRRILANSEHAQFAVRYARTFSAISDAMKSEGLRVPVAIGKRGGGIDRDKLKDLLGQDLSLEDSQNMTVAARATAERKTFGHLS